MGLSGYRHYSGSILLDQEPIDDLSIRERASRGVTMAWQEPARFEGISVRSFVTLNTPEEKREEAAREALAAVGFDPDAYLDRRVDKTLSGGERKRIELASILTMHPRLVLMDEPDSGIDIEALQRIFEVVEMLKSKGVTVLLITHSGAVLERADHAFLLCCGRVVEKGAVNKIEHFFNDRCIPCDHKNRPEKTGNE